MFEAHVRNNNLKPFREFYHNSCRFWRRCSKPDWREYKKIGVATLIGVLLMGCIGYFVRLITIPVNNILMAP
ncbi:unnamed protein product [Larinioides sclopetarius]|uniref:Uncharacterized protein n=1 Tax=Larinioides sclopetarius TaxID=280406 RepID=A0AAV2BEE0_9ARAC